MKITANLVDILNKEIKPSTIEVKNGVIEKITPTDQKCDTYILPGFIDSHIHIESSMLIPSEFARLAVLHGTVATVSDPHEIANVLGIKGVEFMLENGEQTNFKFYFGASPCVPATPFETSGDILDLEAVTTLLKNPKIKFLSEVMNFPGVINGDIDMLEKIKASNDQHKPIDGHAPALSGEELQKYIDAGITTDHEAFTYEEGLEKLQNGMKILIREGSAAKNFDALHKLIDEYYMDLMFCSDDRHPNDLLKGHINEFVIKAIELGHDLFKVLQIACINPIKHYDLEVGMLSVGDSADFIEVENLQEFKVLQTVINGKVVAKDSISLLNSVVTEEINKFESIQKTAEEFYLPKCEHMEVIQVLDHELITFEKVADEECEDILKIAVINRYENTKITGIAHAKGFKIRDGAIASSVAHDSHNIIVVGTSDEYMANAVNLIIKNKGGVSAVNENETHILPLSIAGIMSNQDGFIIAQQYEELNHFVKNKLGTTLSAPFMTLSFMALLVIPEIKLSDKGLFDGRSFEFISPCKDDES